MEKYLLTEDAIAVQVVERHYSVREVADLLKVGLDFVYDRLKTGELAPVVELGDSRANQPSTGPTTNQKKNPQLQLGARERKTFDYHDSTGRGEHVAYIWSLG